MLLALGPLARISPAVGPANFSVAVLFVIAILTPVDFPALGRPLEDALTMHHVVAPLSFIAPAVRPSVLANSRNVVVTELPFVARVVSPHEDTVVAVFLPSDVRPRIGGSIRPSLDAYPMLLVRHPLALVDRPVCVEVFSVTVSLAVKPVALVEIAFAPVFLVIIIIERRIEVMAGDLAAPPVLLA